MIVATARMLLPQRPIEAAVLPGGRVDAEVEREVAGAGDLPGGGLDIALEGGVPAQEGDPQPAARLPAQQVFEDVRAQAVDGS